MVFLNNLAQNSKLFSEYKKNPERVMTEAGLNVQQIQAMLTRDASSIYSQINAASLGGPVAVAVVTGHPKNEPVAVVVTG